MSKLATKYTRYKNVIAKVENWPEFLFRKLVGFKQIFTFKMRDFGAIDVPKKMHSPFKENFIDEVYFKHIPSHVFKNNDAPLIFDVGANVGYFSLSAFRKFPKAIVHAFEPHPFCFKTIQKYKDSFANYNWNIHHQALSNVDGTITIHTNDTEEFTTMASITPSENQQKIVVPSSRLDTFHSEHELSTIDFIKLDCEGSEYDILYAMQSEFFDQIRSLCIETHFSEKEGCNTEALNTFINEKGFQTITSQESNYLGYIWAWRP